MKSIHTILLLMAIFNFASAGAYIIANERHNWQADFMIFTTAACLYLANQVVEIIEKGRTIG